MEQNKKFIRERVLHHINFKKKFFKTIENVENLFKTEFKIIDFKKNKSLIVGNCYRLNEDPNYKEKIIISP